MRIADFQLNIHFRRKNLAVYVRELDDTGASMISNKLIIPQTDKSEATIPQCTLQLVISISPKSLTEAKLTASTYAAKISLNLILRELNFIEDNFAFRKFFVYCLKLPQNTYILIITLRRVWLLSVTGPEARDCTLSRIAGDRIILKVDLPKPARINCAAGMISPADPRRSHPKNQFYC